ncbi:MAG TPA: ATP-binding protein [Dermatophilaceae bacterium]
MSETARATLIGQVASVRGGLVRVKLREIPSTLVMVAGEAYRVGQIGAFVRIPLGYTQLYGVCTQVGADAAPPISGVVPSQLEISDTESLVGYRWLSLALFGEAVGRQFERGVGQYPTIGDEVHLVTNDDLAIIYGDAKSDDAITIGRIADSANIPGRLLSSALVSRHCCVVGSTGAGKSNLVAVLLEVLSGDQFPSARLLVIDPHGEYSSTVGDKAHVIQTGMNAKPATDQLRVPYWALPLEELLALTMRDLQPHVVEQIRDRVRAMKLAAAQHLAVAPPLEAVTADSPLPFSIRQLWFELEDDERATYSHSNDQTDQTKNTPIDAGDAATLRSPQYPPATSYNTAPYPSRKRRSIGRQLDLLRTRLLDSRYAFMFDPTDLLAPDLTGKTESDLDSLLAAWVGRDAPVTILDVSGLPADVLGPVVGCMVQLVYDALFWAAGLDVGGRAQPLLVVVDEAHRFIPQGEDSVAQRAFARIAKEGRKYGVGLMLVTQRPSDIDSAVLSQCGTVLALRLTNAHDRSAVASALPDDLGGLADLLPSLRTGELLAFGDALQVPSRIRVRRAIRKPIGDDPPLPEAWLLSKRPDPAHYADAIRNWRAQTVSTADTDQENPKCPT